MQTVDRETIEEWLVGPGKLVLIEVLPEEQFNEFHLPGAINIPEEADDFELRVVQEVPDKSSRVVVYCKDRTCTASERAAQRLATLGFVNVYDYDEGKDAWLESGNVIETH